MVLPEAPGRVVNLLEADDPESKVWGVAYEINDKLWEEEIKAQLDYRYCQHWPITSACYFELEANCIIITTEKKEATRSTEACSTRQICQTIQNQKRYEEQKEKP